MSIETRSSSALFKRAEQLKRWEDSETNREPSVPKNKSRRIKFSSGCVFLAACAAGDKEEVLRLIQKGADIDTANVDGLTALHQACIDDNLDMVEFLVENGADVNRGDNEGWTPLHATASCGFQSIAKYLLENGADVAAVNNDGELAIDIAECEPMEDLLQAEINQKGVDCDSARSQEERRMLQDARDWVSGDSDVADTPHPKTGATALHVAAAKGYIEVMNALLQGSRPVDVDRQDADGWTPLHAAAHWGQKEAARILADNLADMDMKNYVGQTPFDVADTDMFRYLEELKKTQSAMNNDLIIKQTKRRSDTKLAQADDTETEKPPKVKKVEVEIGKDNENEINLADSNVALDMDLSLSSDTESETSSETSESETGSENITDDEKKNRVNAEANRIPTSEHNNIGAVRSQAPAAPPRSISDNAQEDTTLPAWRRPASFRSRLGNDSPTKLSLRISDKDSKSPTSPPSRNNTDADVLLRRTQSFESDEKFYLRLKELRERIKANSCPTIPASPTSQNKTSPKVDNKHYTFDRLGTLPSNNNNNTSRQLNNKLFKTSSTVNFLSCTDSCTNKVSVTSTLIVNRNPTYSTTTANTTSASLTDNQKSTSVANNLTEQRQSVNRSYSLRSDRCWPPPRPPSRRTSRESLQDVTVTAVTTTVTTPTVTTSTANTSPTKVTTTAGSPTATSPQPTSQVRSVTNKAPATVVTPATPPTPSGQTVPNTPTTPTGGSKLSPGNIFKNFFKSFVPPVRDEESETQRKAHAKRVRETRRSTQGVTLDEIKSAEQLVKRKNQPANSTTTSQSTANNNSEPSNGDQSNGSNSQPSVTATITTGVPTVAAQSDGADDSSNMLQERRPSWRLRVDNGSKFKLEDATATSTAAPTVFVRRGTGSAPPRPASAPVESGSQPTDSNVTVPLRRTSKQLDDKEQDKENDVRNAQATQAVIQRRRRPKRRSTGVVHVDMDEIDPDKQDSSGGGDYDDSSKLNHQDSGSESNRSSRLGSSGDIARAENGEINYKELWEQSQADNERLRVKLRQTDEELRDAKQALERITTATTKNSLSELEKREKRAMERKLSEMEEELKQLQKLKAENERLRAENRALTRVVNKLTNTTGK